MATTRMSANVHLSKNPLHRFICPKCGNTIYMGNNRCGHFSTQCGGCRTRLTIDLETVLIDGLGSFYPKAGEAPEFEQEILKLADYYRNNQT